MYPVLLFAWSMERWYLPATRKAVQIGMYIHWPKNFEDFLRLILACGTADPVEQIVWMDKRQFEEHMEHEEKILTQEQRAAVQQLQREMGLLPIETPFEYVKAIQKDFDDSKIQYSDEYYEVTGREAPKETDTPNKTLLEFQTVTVEVRGQNDRV